METTANFKSRHGERIGLGVAVSMALFIVYLTFPSIVTSLGIELSIDLWESPLSAKQGISILIGIIFVSFLLVLTSRVRESRLKGDAIIPLWLIVLIFGVVGALATAFIAIAGFGVTVAVMLSLGVESYIATFVGILVAFLVILMLK